MDVSIKKEEGKFKFRVCGMVLNDDKILAVDINDNGFFCLPGGHVHLGEDTITAVKREIKEEVEIEAEEVKLLAIMQNFFDADEKIFHELGYYYLITPKDLGDKAQDFDFVENDNGELKNLKFRWINLDDMDKVDFRPRCIAEKLKNRDFTPTSIIYKQFSRK